MSGLPPSCPRLIEVALPIREISVESVRDKSLRHGHISTLHQWWARRPLAAARAVAFASLVPDPDHPECPTDFRNAVARLLRDEIPPDLRRYSRARRVVPDPDPYRPYGEMEDTLRNRLIMFVARWSPETLRFDSGDAAKEPDPKELLDDRCLVKWEVSDPSNHQGRVILDIARRLVTIANGGIATVLDPFSGGGAIPLEAGRIGCQSVANDYNPVAYLILRATCEFPQKYGKPGNRAVVSTGFGQQVEHEDAVANVLLHDVKRYALRVLDTARDEIGCLYPAGADGIPSVAYYWARTARCANPSCRGEIPLLRTLLLCNRDSKRAALTMQIDKATKTIEFGVAEGKCIVRTEGTKQERGPVTCPFCDQPTTERDLREAGKANQMGERLVAVITDRPGGKEYRSVEPGDLEAVRRAEQMAAAVESPSEPILPEITTTGGDVSNSTGIRVHLYGLDTWGSLYNPRQLVAMQALVRGLREALAALHDSRVEPDYGRAIACYLGLWVSRMAARLTSVGRWHCRGEKLETPFDMAKISMTWDFPEVNPFNDSTGGALSQLDWILRVIARESPPVGSGVLPAQVIRGDGAAIPAEVSAVDAVVTDPPYFDEIAYADVSDLFYVWLKRALWDEFPEACTTPSTPKGDEATALRHRHQGDGGRAERHFTTKLAACFAAAEQACKPGGVQAVMFAHQTTEAWTALVHALFEAGLTITATYPIDTELKNRTRGLVGSALASSITVICRPREVGSSSSFRAVRREIEGVVQASVHRFWGYGFRGADLIVACYGPAVGVFGRYERVERADGTPVTVPELLTLVRQSALRAIAGEFEGDSLSRLYFVWANLYGVIDQAWDDARMVVQIGSEADNAMEVARGQGIFVVDGASCRLALLEDRAERRHLGEDLNPPLIDALHRAMLHWKQENRHDLVWYLHKRGLLDDGPFWKLAQALFEVLPRTGEDWKLISALLGERETLRTEAKRAPSSGGQLTLATE